MGKGKEVLGSSVTWTYVMSQEGAGLSSYASLGKKIYQLLGLAMDWKGAEGQEARKHLG